MSKANKFNLTLVFVVCLLCAVFCISAAADEAEEMSFTESPVFIDGLLSCRGYTVGENTYLPIETACALFGYEAKADFDNETNTLTVMIENVKLTVCTTDKFFTANDRCFYLPDGYVEVDSQPAIPLEAVAKLFDLSIECDPYTGVYDLGTENKSLLSNADEYYGEEDLYWMSRVISYEAGNQSLEGQIGVGAVVMNRVRSDKFEDTVKDVIFSPGQFGAVDSDAIYLDPYDMGVIAAKLVLEGYNTVGDALYFHQGEYSEKWTIGNEYFVVKIGVHNFFEKIAYLPRV